jgi:hypothetical protein
VTPLELLSSAAFGVVFGAGVAWGAFGTKLRRHDEMIGNGKPGVFVRVEAMTEWRKLVADWREADAARAQRLEESLQRLADAVERR